MSAQDDNEPILEDDERNNKDLDSKEAKITSTAPEPSDDSPCNLIVKYLPDSIDEQGLLRLFSSYGEVVKCRLIFDKTTNRSKGYGFVKFATEKQADAATKALNGHHLESKTLRVNPANPAFQKNGAQQAANVYVAGIPKTFTKDELFRMFSPYGNIIESKVLVDKSTNQNRGVGFIKYSSYEGGNAAIQALNGTTPDGCATPLTVKFAKFKQGNQPNMRNNMFNFKNPQSGYGPIRQNFGFNNMQGFQDQSQFGFNQFNNGQMMPNQFGMNQMQFGMGGSDAFNMMQGYGQPNDDAGLFVFHLPPNADESQLFGLFSGFGTVVNAKIIRDNATQHSKGYGFVNMSTALEAQNAINALNGFQMGGKYLKVSFKKKK